VGGTVVTRRGQRGIVRAEEIFDMRCSRAFGLVCAALLGSGAGAATVEYAVDDGSGNTNQGPPSTFSPEMLWGNYFTVQPGGEVITTIRVAWGPTFDPNRVCTFWLLEDPDDDGDPRNAVAVASVTGLPGTLGGNVYNDFAIPPTLVAGGFFVGTSAFLNGGVDRPARVDTTSSPLNSWFFYDPDIDAVINNLAGAAFGTRMDNTQFVVFPGAFMVRAIGVPAPACPADLDGDGQVGASDLATLLGSWGQLGGPADLDSDGSVGAPDLASLLGSWGPC
jgi:hypothetical protein